MNSALFLTLIRLFVSPTLLPLSIVYGIPFNNSMLNTGVALFFILLSVTDYIDGYLARTYFQTTLLGKILDPLADKLLICSTLIALLTIQKIGFYWVILLISRELWVMSLRLVALENSIPLDVAFHGKYKTLCHILCLAFIIINPYYYVSYAQAPVWQSIELVLLGLAVASSWSSGLCYYLYFKKECSKRGIILTQSR